ncbi:DUF2169 domain-containing protein [Myxococcus sp. RHSTA-1-4]|uniref:DUF2169 family type VI secretion system accessory protein n=1 Tax=Myxococcus sp. RHSTA-1-4 TaxID=2874601 RepID=UPI001CC04C32|nr:DUF2169 domain-containing protein [Myxococcus sp. RHSTA-1-4]MBZ4421359.1 DUF2169 domain-containing protein [Myxococcus sp. RHSTA-1-4]
MLQVTNTTPFEAGIDLFPDARGVDTLYVMLKATFEIAPSGQGLRVAEKQVPILTADVHWGKPGASSVRYAGERHLCKPSTDVVLVGQAHAPRGKPVTELGVQLSVANLSKSIHVTGDRVWRSGILSPGISAPEPFLSMPLTYERSFGGTHVPERGETSFEPRNPVGRGFRGRRGAQELSGLPLPNLEDPRHPVAKAGDRAVPACFGPVAPSWVPRKRYAGTYDQGWRKHRAPSLPEDFDARFFHVAPADLIAPSYLKGGEPVRLVNLLPEGECRFQLPLCVPAIQAHIADSVETPRANLETVLIEPEERRVCMLWRAAAPCDKQVLRVRHVAVSLETLQLKS